MVILHAILSLFLLWQKGTKKLTKEDVIESLIALETEYVERLDKLIKVFVRPLSEHPLTSKYRQILFSNVKVRPPGDKCLIVFISSISI